MKINLSGVSLKGNERKYVLEVLNSGILSMGKFTENFEKSIAKYSGRKEAVAVSSGTAGLFLLLKAYGIGQGHDVITSPFSFISSANVIEHTGASAVFADIDRHTLCISVDEIINKIDKDYRLLKGKLVSKNTGNELKGILSVDIFGAMPDYGRLKALCAGYGLPLFEDACEALGSDYKGRKAGSFGKGSVFAFYPNKQITTGEGGIVLIDSAVRADYIRAMRNQGRKSMDLWLTHHYLGYNFRINELSSAVGLAQMERIDDILEKRDKAAQYYIRNLSGIGGLHSFTGKKYGRTGWFVFTVQVQKKRNALMKHLLEMGIGTRPYFTPIHLQPYYKKKYGYTKGLFPVAESAAASSAALPFHTDIKRKEQDIVIDTVKRFLV